MFLITLVMRSLSSALRLLSVGKAHLQATQKHLGCTHVARSEGTFVDDVHCTDHRHAGLLAPTIRKDIYKHVP